MKELFFVYFFVENFKAFTFMFTSGRLKEKYKVDSFGRASS
jgi:hypothetical protein